MILETVSEPPYGWWTTPDEKMIQQESAGIMPATITELDIEDPETVWVVYVQCEICEDDPAPALEMVRQFDGAWLCATCDRRQQAEYDDRMRAAQGR